MRHMIFTRLLDMLASFTRILVREKQSSRFKDTQKTQKRDNEDGA